MASGSEYEAKAARYLEASGLRVLAQNWSGKFGEVDIVAKEQDGTLVFVEVRHRKNSSHGGAAASVTTSKQRKLALTARSYLSGLSYEPSVRFDVIAFEGERLEHIRGAFWLD